MREWCDDGTTRGQSFIVREDAWNPDKLTGAAIYLWGSEMVCTFEMKDYFSWDYDGSPASDPYSQIAWSIQRAVSDTSNSKYLKFHLDYILPRLEKIYWTPVAVYDIKGVEDRKVVLELRG